MWMKDYLHKFLGWAAVVSLVVGLILIGLLSAKAAALSPENHVLTPQEAAAKLRASVFSFGDTRGLHGFCSAAKIGPLQYLTARHCVGFDNDYRLVGTDGTYVFLRSMVVPLEEKRGAGKFAEDWAILSATAENDAPALSLACGEPVTVGDPVAYMGYPEGLQEAFGVGYVSTKKGYRNNADIFVDLPAAPGASGASVISLKSGHIMGVLTEGVFNTRTREFYMIGLESVEHLDACEDWAKRMKHWENIEEETFHIIQEQDKPRFVPTPGSKKGDDGADWT
jgi:hypothetical protein